MAVDYIAADHMVAGHMAVDYIAADHMVADHMAGSDNSVERSVVDTPADHIAVLTADLKSAADQADSDQAQSSAAASHIHYRT